jgi:hypothetical protein
MTSAQSPGRHNRRCADVGTTPNRPEPRPSPSLGDAVDMRVVCGCSDRSVFWRWCSERPASRYVLAATPAGGGRAATRWTGCGCARLLAGHRSARSVRLPGDRSDRRTSAVVDLLDDAPALLARSVAGWSVADDIARRRRDGRHRNVLVVGAGLVRAPPTSGQDSPGGQAGPAQLCSLGVGSCAKGTA